GGLRGQGRCGKLASVPPWALPADEPAPPAAADTARIDVAPAVGDEDTAEVRRPSTTKRVGVKRATATRAKKAGAAKKVGAKKVGGAKKAAGAKKAGAKKVARRASAAKKR